MTVSTDVSKYMGNAVKLADIWGKIIVNVKATPFLAKGDGITDDTEAIQAAISYAISIGKSEVTFPAGTYLYGVLTNTDGMTFLGDGVTLNGTTPISITSIAALKAETMTGVVNAVTRFGADTTGVTDSYTALQNALTAAATEGKSLYLPSGTYLSSASLASSGKSLAIIGDSISLTRIIFTSDNGGFDLTLNSQGVNTPPQQLFIRDLTIESRANVSSPAITATWSTYQANAQGQLWINRVQITRKYDGTGSFTNGIKLKNCFVGEITDSIILGDDLRISSVGVYLEDCVSIRIKETDINRYATGVKVRAVSAIQSEGVLLQNCSVYDVFSGIDVINAIGINLLGTHVNINGTSATYSVKLDNVKQSVIDSCLIYAGGSIGDASNQDGLQILSSSTSVLVNNTQFVSVTPANARCAILTSGGVGFCMFNGNSINFFPTGISFPASGDTLNHVTNNLFYSVTTPITDLGTNNFVTDNTSDGTPINSQRWGTVSGKFRTGEISTNASWGGFIKGHTGTAADLAFVDSDGNVAAFIHQGTLKVKNFVKSALPSATETGGLIYVSDDAVGAVIAFSDGTNWRRVTDRAVIS